jgi:hypothetical protein
MGDDLNPNESCYGRYPPRPCYRCHGCVQLREENLIAAGDALCLEASCVAYSAAIDLLVRHCPPRCLVLALDVTALLYYSWLCARLRWLSLHFVTPWQYFVAPPFAVGIATPAA